MGSTRSLKILLLLVVLAAAGCATLDSAPMVPDAAWFDTQLAAGDYVQATAALQQWRTQHPDDAQLPELQKKFDVATAQLRDAAIDDARQLSAQQHWADADQRLLGALQQLPDDAALKTEYAQFDQHREQQREQAQHEFDMAYARALPGLIRHARAVFELKPQDLNAAAQLKSLQDCANSIAPRLRHASSLSQQQGDIAAAAERMRLAAQLSGDANLEQQATQLEQQLAKSSGKRAPQKTQRSSSALAGSLAALDAALDGNQLETAQSTLKVLQAKYPGNAQVQQRAQRYEAQRQSFVTKAIEQGKRFYSTGELGKAIDIWESAYLLDSGNEDLRDRIDRARRFRAKVESLQ